jgi:hypothetical protein
MGKTFNEILTETHVLLGDWMEEWKKNYYGVSDKDLCDNEVLSNLCNQVRTNLTILRSALDHHVRRLIRIVGPEA